MSGSEIADYVRKGLGAYDSCIAGDNFSPHGVWDKLLSDMDTAAGYGISKICLPESGLPVCSFREPAQRILWRPVRFRHALPLSLK